MASFPWECSSLFNPQPFTCFMSGLGDFFPIENEIIEIMIIGSAMIIAGFWMWRHNSKPVIKTKIEEQDRIR